MDNLLRAVVVGIGMLIGIIRPEAPAVSGRVYRDDTAVFINVEATGAFPEDALRLLESGNELALEYRVSMGAHGQITLIHSVRYNPLSRIYTVGIGETGSEHRTDSCDAALAIASQATGVRLLPSADFDAARGLALTVACALHCPDTDASAVWNYVTPETRISFSTLNGIPR